MFFNIINKVLLHSLKTIMLLWTYLSSSDIGSSPLNQRVSGLGEALLVHDKTASDPVGPV